MYKNGPTKQPLQQHFSIQNFIEFPRWKVFTKPISLNIPSIAIKLHANPQSRMCPYPVSARVQLFLINKQQTPEQEKGLLFLQTVQYAQWTGSANLLALLCCDAVPNATPHPIPSQVTSFDSENNFSLYPIAYLLSFANQKKTNQPGICPKRSFIVSSMLFPAKVTPSIAMMRSPGMTQSG